MHEILEGNIRNVYLQRTLKASLIIPACTVVDIKATARIIIPPHKLAQKTFARF